MTGQGTSDRLAEATAVATFGRWRSPISIESIFSQPAAPAYPFRHDGVLYFLQSLAAEAGRIALMRWQGERAVCMTPAGFNIRSAVHEYGGKCFCIVGDEIVFNNFADGALYRQPLRGAGSPVALTAVDQATIGYADLHCWRDPDDSAQWIICVSEKTGACHYNDNALCAIPFYNHSETVLDDTLPQQLQAGADFYASPVTSGYDMAWVQWQLPDMPWDRAALHRGTIVRQQDRLVIENHESVLDQPQHSVCQPGFLRDGSLVYACDSPGQDWWNLFRFADGEHSRLTDLQAEIGEAHWVFGQVRWLEVDNGLAPGPIVCIATSHHGDRLLKVTIDAGVRPAVMLLEEAALGQLWIDLYAVQPTMLVVASPEDHSGEIREVNYLNSQITTVGPESAPLMAAGYAAPEAMTIPTADGEMTNAYFYPPFNPEFKTSRDTLPPLVVMVHGGPTSRSSRSFNPLRQYYASLGFAILDINHRGSTGYGRQYRQRLLGGWGEIDCSDIADSVHAVIAQRKADADAIFIRGGSAGGYAVLRALTRQPSLFAGGACYYGIGNLITLSEITHKFEGKYTDKLVGEVFDPETARLPQSRYVRRSPIFEMDRLTAPLIMFQGLRDKVVPPKVTREVVALLEERGICHDYVEYEHEGHGFRALETKIDSLRRETRFFTELLDDN